MGNIADAQLSPERARRIFNRDGSASAPCKVAILRTSESSGSQPLIFLTSSSLKQGTAQTPLVSGTDFVGFTFKAGFISIVLKCNFDKNRQDCQAAGRERKLQSNLFGQLQYSIGAVCNQHETMVPMSKSGSLDFVR